jgi:hypothetical protein
MWIWWWLTGISTGQLWNENYSTKIKYSEKHPFWFHFACHESHTDWLVIERESSQWKSAN